MEQLKPGHVLTLKAEIDHDIRLDQFLARQFPEHSRTFFQKIISQGRVRIHGVIVTKPRYILKSGDTVSLHVPELRSSDQYRDQIRELDVQLMYEHEHFLVIGKSAGLVVYAPHRDYKNISLVDWLKYYYKDIEGVGNAERPGIVHRLDKDTSGIMVIARTNYAHVQLSMLFKERALAKIYQALVEGVPPQEGVIDLRVSRHPLQPQKMTHKMGGREAITQYKVLEQFKKHALLELRPLTGRTHQIRVHCAGMGHPVLGDIMYGKRSPLIERQALHAYALAFEFDGISYNFFQDPPTDFLHALKLLRNM